MESLNASMTWLTGDLTRIITSIKEITFIK